jgi:hypothetical protein
MNVQLPKPYGIVQRDQRPYQAPQISQRSAAGLMQQLQRNISCKAQAKAEQESQ